MIFIYYNVTLYKKNTECRKIASPAGLQKNFRKKPKFEPNHHNCKFRFIFCSSKYIPVQFRAKSEFVRSKFYCAAQKLNQKKNTPACNNVGFESKLLPFSKFYFVEFSPGAVIQP